MGRFAKVSQDAFDQLEVDAGVLLTSFDPDNPELVDANIICATTGGINAVCTPTYSDWGEDIDNVPNNMLELKHLDGWDCRFSTTALGTSARLIRLTLGAADVAGDKITPRRDLKKTDFSDLWYVGDRSDGGFVAIKLLNALSTGGFSLQTTKNGKGQISIELTGHVSIEDQDTMPMEFYTVDGEDVGEYTYTAITPAGTENPNEEGWYVLVGDAYRLTSDTEVDDNVTYYERTEV